MTAALRAAARRDFLRQCQTSQLPRRVLVRVLQIGPQSARPPGLHGLSKADLLRAIYRTTVTGGPAGDAMRAAVVVAREEAACPADFP